ncbi:MULTISPECIES: aldehyde dehydrogenase family protein [unclassified Rhodococcus (in: high G+C Gram-positive bacteria)]|uniref:aldehyde dehydrogenase family protein n=1 Tax=unclassified Rhodococcus (in: high G+C Gram-positive bacteria) TaxID=192944 RepID=UPI002795C867|nr:MULTISPECIES: aldehyde dehydrogenase family protein [unclassified Rhodococcus (in: high G+C Gram-positive bacteria)]
MYKAHNIAAGFNAGTVWVNSYHVLDPVLPFRGYKQSGWAESMVRRSSRRHRNDDRDPQQGWPRSRLRQQHNLFGLATPGRAGRAARPPRLQHDSIAFLESVDESGRYQADRSERRCWIDRHCCDGSTGRGLVPHE